MANGAPRKVSESTQDFPRALPSEIPRGTFTPRLSHIFSFLQYIGPVFVLAPTLPNANRQLHINTELEPLLTSQSTLNTAPYTLYT